jgi:SAM-dependent methyltransferase
VALLTARAGCITTGIDIASNLIAQARNRAALEGLQIDFKEGDAEELPFADASFDMVISMSGIMFAPQPDIATKELLRVCRSGGMIAMTNWTQEGFLGDNLKILAKHLPPSPRAISPLLWGNEETVRSRLGDAVTDLKMTRRIARVRYPFGPAQAVDFYRQFYGPTVRAFAALDPCGQSRLHADMEELFARHNTAGNEGTEIRVEYLESIATRK